MKTGITVITVARKPLSEGSVAENVLKWDTGGFNIDGTRLACDDHPGVHKREGDVFSPTLKGKPKTKDSGIYHTPTGRWPTNLVLAHLPGCRVEGTKKIKTARGQPTRGKETRLSGIYSPHQRAFGQPVGFADESGQETAPNWVCVEGCSVTELDEQSARDDIEVWVVSKLSMPNERRPRGQERAAGHKESGGASRYFKQVKTGEER